MLVLKFLIAVAVLAVVVEAVGVASRSIAQDYGDKKQTDRQEHVSQYQMTGLTSRRVDGKQGESKRC